ncbi:MAG: hypothetical protein KAY24_01875, partial [Candidatus Eisenbacteria sp.]|nr:hypothetical protein [Candidatus Eisenbacteria bacterium]
ALARCGGGWQGLDVSVCLPLAIILLGFAFLGALDDARGLSPLVRLLVEVGLVGVALLFMPPLWMGLDSLPGTRGLLAVFLIVTGANAFNMSDNADGLAAGTGCLSFLAAYLVPGLPGSLALAALAAAGALAGFLFWNRPPARLYLGDVGTLPLGALLACALVIRAEPLSVIQALAALLMAGYLIFDPLYAVAGRLGRGRAPWKGGVDHPSHDLRRLFGRWPPAWRLILGVHAFSVLTGWGVMIGILPSAAIPVGLLSWSALLVVAMRGRAR